MSRFYNLEIHNAHSKKVRRIDLDDQDYIRVVLAGGKGEFDLFTTEDHSELTVIVDKHELRVRVHNEPHLGIAWMWLGKEYAGG